MEQLYELSARAEPIGGDIAVNTIPPLLVGESRLTILIHGFNNDTDQATRSFRRFLRATDLREHPLAAGRICLFFWPGDHGWYRYSSEIARAKRAAEVLRDYLRDIAAGGRIEVSLVCHSLGNRVALELAALCLEPGAPVVDMPRACLMAAAVPVELVGPTGDLRPAVERIERRHVLFSETDEALGLAFLIGQIPADGDTVDAIGKRGEPAGLWTEAVDMTPYAHGDYWWEEESASQARYLFGICTMRLLPVRRSAIARRLMPLIGLPRRDVVDRKMFPGLRGD